MPGGRYGVCFRYIGCVMYMILLEGQMAFFAERVGFGLDCERVYESHGGERNGRPWWWCPDRLIALYGRGDDDDDAGVVIGLTGTGVPHYHYFLVQNVSDEPRRRCRCRCRSEAKRRTHNRLVPEPANSEGAEG